MPALYFVAALLILSSMSLYPAWAAEPTGVPPIQLAASQIANLHWVAPAVLRGGQPTTAGLKYLKQAGVKTIINLRNEEVLVNREAAAARALGLKFVNIPLDVFNEPSEQAVKQFLQAVDNEPNKPVFIHCLYGRDRTGTMVALYRVHKQNWPPQKAYEEMIRFGFKAPLTRLSRYVFDYSQRTGPTITPAVHQSTRP